MVDHEWSSGNNGVVEDAETWGSGDDATAPDGPISVWYILGPLIVTVGVISMIVLNARWQARLTQSYYGDRVRIVNQHE